MSPNSRLSTAAYLLKRLVLKGEAQRFAPLGAPEVRPGAPPEYGVVDEVGSHVVRGWARRLDDLETLVRVDVYFDGEFLGRAPCNLAREDLVGLPGFHRSGRHGFEYLLPEYVRRAAGDLRLVASDSGLELAGSPLRFDGRAPPEVGAAVPELLSKVWYPGAPAHGVGSLAEIEHAYGRRLAILAQIDPEASGAGWPVTRAMTYVNARNHSGRLPYHGARAYFELLVAAAAHFAPARAGLPMDAAQIEALTEPTGWVLAGHVRSTRILDAFAKARKIESAGDVVSATVFLTRFVVEVLARHRLPIELLSADARDFLRADAPNGDGVRFESAFRGLPRFADAPHGSAAAAAAVRLAAWDLGLQDLAYRAGPSPPLSQDAAPAVQGDGVRIITGDHGESGLSLNARNSLAALKSIGVETRVDSAPLSSPSPCESYDNLSRPWVPTVLLHLPPHDAVEVIVRLSPEQASARLIGFFMWETETLPDVHHLGALLVDEIWTGSHYCEDIFRAAVPATPIHWVGHAVHLAEPDPEFDARAWAGVGAADFIFLFHFDAHSWITRKNPTAIVRAFRLAFEAQVTGVRLVLKLRRSEDWHLEQWRHWWEEFYEEARQDGRIVILHDNLSGARMSSLTHAADAFVSLHRSEGFGYGLAEAMLAGKPVIASAHGGNLDFTLPGETMLVPAPRRPTHLDEFLYASSAQVWGEPDVAAAASAMRLLYADHTLACRLGLSGRERVERECSLQALAARYADILHPRPDAAADAGALEAGSR